MRAIYVQLRNLSRIHVSLGLIKRYLRHIERMIDQLAIQLTYIYIILTTSIKNYKYNYVIYVQCYLPIHDLLIHYPCRFTVSYLFLKTSDSRINKKIPPNSWINSKKKPTNSRFFLIILQWIGRNFVNFEFTENSWSQKTWIGR